MIWSSGVSPTGSSGFGIEKVKGRSLVPRPPTRTTAFTPSDPVDVRIVESRVLAHPLDRAQKPLVQAHLRLPAEQLARLRCVGDKVVDLARGGADSLLGLAHWDVSA